ncbi:MAG TPA: RNA polymerase subunit sigma-70 [Planctomycetaceae bacterium]|nr:RNA polymerase subunit sigma-70 [Planctomycetaceae bacterium]
MYAIAEKTSPRSFGETLTYWTDEELLLDYRVTQRREVFEELVQRYERELYNYLRHYLGNAEMAEDAFQSTFLQIHLKGEQFEEGRMFRPWLYRIATNQAIDIRRKNRRQPAVSLDTCGEKYDNPTSGFADSIPSDDLTPLERTLKDERAREVREALQHLPQILKQALYLVYFEGMMYQEAAESLGIPFGTVKSRLSAAVKKLNRLLSEESYV